MKKTLLIVGHPDAESYNFTLADAYEAGVGEGAIPRSGSASSGPLPAELAGAAAGAVRRINIRDLNFNPNLQFGYRKRTALEPICWPPGKTFSGPTTWSGSIPSGGGGAASRHEGLCFPAFMPVRFTFSSLFRHTTPAGRRWSGEWKIIIRDNIAQDNGSLVAWSVEFGDNLGSGCDYTVEVKSSPVSTGGVAGKMCVNRSPFAPQPLPAPAAAAS